MVTVKLESTSKSNRGVASARDGVAILDQVLFVTSGFGALLTGTSMKALVYTTPNEMSCRDESAGPAEGEVRVRVETRTKVVPRPTSGFGIRKRWR